METIAERKAYLTKDIDKLKFKYNGELSLAVEGRYTNLRIWIGNEKSVAEGGGRLCVYMRLDKYNNYSVPLDMERAKYVKNETIHFLASQFKFGCGIECLDKILEITKDLKQRNCLSW
jgi:hypothetical protein